jgi:Secretion system C-terminal sorting domain
VFVVGDTNAVSYTMQYAYPLNPAVVPVNKGQLLLFKRMHNAIGSWTLDNTTTNDTTNNHYVTIGHNTEYMLGYSQVPLAINDLNFDIIKENINAILNWNVTTTDNINNFEVMRSTNGITYTSIAKVDKSNAAFYNYTDANLLSGKYYYKIKLNDINKQSTYSTTRQIEIVNAATVQVYPNPATTVITIATTAPKFDYSIRNALGQIVYLGNSATNNQTINIQLLSNGIYTINIKTGLTMQVVKFTKQ